MKNIPEEGEHQVRELDCLWSDIQDLKELMLWTINNLILSHTDFDHAQVIMHELLDVGGK